MPASDLASHDPAFSPQQGPQCARIMDGIRRINAKVVRLPGSLDSLASFRFAFDCDPPSDVFPFDPATGGGGPA